MADAPQAIKRLRLPYDMADGESAVGAAVAACRQHRLSRVTTMLSGAGMADVAPLAIQRLDRARLAILADAIRTDPERLAAGVFGEAAGMEVTVHGRGFFKRSDLELRRRRISPSSLAERPHHRASWLIRHLPYCPESLELLVDSCPDCGPLGWFSTLGIDTCENCGLKVPAADEPPLAPELVDDYRFFAALVSIEPGRRALALERLPECLRRFPISALVGVAIRASLAADPSFRSCWRQTIRLMVPPRAAAVVARAMGLLSGWPATIRSVMIDRVQEVPGDPGAYRRIVSQVRWIGASTTRDDESMAVVETAFPRIRGKGADGLDGASGSYTPTDLRAGHGLSSTEIARLKASGAVRFIPVPSLKQRRALYDREDVDRIGANLGLSVTITQASANLRIPEYAVRQFAAAGLLEEMECAGVQALRGRSIVTSSIQRLEQMLAARTEAADGRPTIRAANLLKGIPGEKPWALIFLMMLDGRMSCVGPIGSDLRKIEVVGLNDMSMLKLPKGARELRRWSLVPTRDASNVLGVKDNALHPLLEQMGITTSTLGKGRGVAGNDLFLLARETVFLPEIVNLHSWSPKRAVSEIRLAGIQRRRGGWCRASMIQQRFVAPYLPFDDPTDYLPV